MPTIRNLWPYPVNFELTQLERQASRLGHLPGYCCVCGRATVFQIDTDLRERVPCLRCGSVNRQRQLATVLLEYAHTIAAPRRPLSIGDIAKETIIWNAETTRALHRRLSEHLGSNYLSSEFISADLSSGTVVDGVLHVDMQHTHFGDDSLDFILSSDVLEHVPNPILAFEESYRILKYGGCHIFTAPFYEHRFTNERRAVVNAEGQLTHLRRPWYHGDPIHEEGALVYNVFAPEVMCQLEHMGFEARLCRLRAPFRGMLGWNGIVMVARKVAEPSHKRDGVFPDDTDWVGEDASPGSGMALA
ncbi:MAG: class I SAM-dependent methyltransferase [Acidimicrobiaceae bacterium]|nr:class I SAM-dependent methyltransferase [Acidimicrobiaceae bacterium]